MEWEHRLQSGTKSGTKAMSRADSQQQGFLGTKMERDWSEMAPELRFCSGVRLSGWHDLVPDFKHATGNFRPLTCGFMVPPREFES